MCSATTNFSNNSYRGRSATVFGAWAQYYNICIGGYKLDDGRSAKFMRYFYFLYIPKLTRTINKKKNIYIFILWAAAVGNRNGSAVLFCAPLYGCKASVMDVPCAWNAALSTHGIHVSQSIYILSWWFEVPFWNHKIASHLICEYSQVNDKNAIQKVITHRMRRSLNPNDTFLITHRVDTQGIYTLSWVNVFFFLL